MSEQVEQKTEPPSDNNSSESKRDMPQTKDNNGESSPESKTDTLQSKDNNKESRYGKTFQVFQKMGLLEYALQMAKVCKENEQLQQKINKLEMEVNESSQKARQGLKDKLEQVSQTTASFG